VTNAVRLPPAVHDASGLAPEEAALRALARAEADRVLDQVEARYRADARLSFDEVNAAGAVRFFADHLRHSKGRFAGQPFVLEPWQARAVRILFGWRWKATGLRVVRRLYIRIPRKNGKSTFVAGLALLLLVAVREGAPEVYGAAGDRAQAGIVFDEATRMVAQSPRLSQVCEAFKTAIVCPRNGGAYKTISAVADTKHGFNPSAYVVDELHVLPNRDLVDVLETAVGAREQPLGIFLTTAGDEDPHSIYAELDDYAAKVRDGVVDDVTFLPVLFGAGPDDPWDDPRTWAKANPSLGVGVRLDYLRDAAAKARSTPAFLPTFRRLHLNVRTSSVTRAIDMAHWDACAGPVPWQDLAAATAGREAWIGLDLSNRVDITARVLVVPPADMADPAGVWTLVPEFYVPEDAMARREEVDRVPYRRWAEAGALVATAGNVVDQARVEADVLADARRHQVRGVGFDSWNAQYLATRLAEAGAPMVEVRQGIPSLGEPTRFLLVDLVAQGRLAHGGHPVLRWMASNLVVKLDDNNNMKPDKRRSAEKIDGIAATVNALALALAAAPDAGSSYLGAGDLVIL
jgi:phage terminase large subunit-like protein